MKNTTRKTLLLVLALTALLAVVALGACQGGGKATLTATFDDSHVVHEGDTLESLKPYVSVTYTDKDGATIDVTDFTLSGTLSEGKCIVSVSYNGLSQKVTVTVLKKSDQQQPKEYTVTLDYDGATGGNEIKSIIVTYGQAIGALPTPTKEGAKFTGWELNGEIVTAKTVWLIDSDATLVAHWLAPTEGLEYELNSDGKSYRVIGIGTATDTSVVIPSTYDNLPVTSIGKAAFNKCSSLTGVIIPNSVTSIGEDVFAGCTSLTDIIIPSSVVSIGGDMFGACNSLESIKVSADNTKYHSSGNCLIETETKKLVAGIKNSVIPTDGGVISIGYGAFVGIEIREITIPDTIVSIGAAAFIGCTSLTSMRIPNGVTSIGKQAFEYCTSLVNVTIPSSVVSIGTSAFKGCSRLESINVSFDNTKYHSTGNCLIETASKKLIAGCKNSVIPTDGSVTSIGSYAFEDCSSLTLITIPSSVTSIGYNAFKGCSGLESIIVSSDNTKYHSAGNCLIETATKTLIAGCKNSVIPIDGSVTSIGGAAFRGCSSLTSITIPSSVTSIGEYAFYGCSSLTSITIPSSVTSIGRGAFSYCSSLENINISSNNTKYHSAGNCLIETATKTLITGCKNSVIPTDGSVTSIGSYAFEDCSSLTSITIPSSVTSIGGTAFYGCSSLTIYCEVASKPSGWDEYWNEKSSRWTGSNMHREYCPVVWDYKPA